MVDQIKTGVDHSFPKNVENYGSYWQCEKLIGGDGKACTRVTISGAFRGVDGVFEFMFDEEGECNHPFFARRRK